MKLKIAKILFISYITTSAFLHACVVSDTGGVGVIEKMCYSCVLPIKIGGIPVSVGPMVDYTIPIPGPLCECPAPPPIFVRIGIPISFFEPNRLIEIVSDAYCYPLMGFSLGSSGTLGGQKNSGSSSKHTFAQAHYIIFPAYSIMQIFTDVLCVEMTEVDIGYVTEIDPLWNNDELGAFISPEALLFGNPVTNLACVADSVSAGVGFPLDPLFWCMGSWGNTYPLSGHKPTGDSYIQDTAGIAAKLIYKLQRELILWQSWGPLGLCSPVPAPIWTKTAYRLQIISPVPHFIAVTPGQTGLEWDYGKNVPMQFDNFGYLLFKKKDCCAF